MEKFCKYFVHSFSCNVLKLLIQQVITFDEVLCKVTEICSKIVKKFHKNFRGNKKGFACSFPKSFNLVM